MSSSEGVVALSILVLAALTGGFLFVQLTAWSPTWEAWLLAAPPNGAGLSAAYVNWLKHLPAWMLVFYGLVVIAMASPVAVRLGR